jgi:hypothetical protein
MDATKRAGLITLVNLPGFATLLEIFNEQCVALERAVFEIDPADGERIQAGQRVAVGARWAFEEMKKRVSREVNEQVEANQKPLSQKEQDELYLKSLVS